MKPRPSLLPWRVLWRIAALLTQQADAHNDAPDRPGYLNSTSGTYVDKALRHLMQHLNGEVMDSSGESNLVCAATDLLIAVELDARNTAAARPMTVACSPTSSSPPAASP